MPATQSCQKFCLELTFGANFRRPAVPLLGPVQHHSVFGRPVCLGLLSTATLQGGLDPVTQNPPVVIADVLRCVWG